MGTTPQFIATPKTPAVAVANADATAFKDFYIAGVGGGRLDSAFATNSDAANAYVVQLAVQKSAVNYVIGEVAIPIGAGTNGTAKSVALLNPVDIPGLGYTESGALYLEPGAKLVIRSKTTVAGSNTLQFTGVGGDY